MRARPISSSLPRAATDSHGVPERETRAACSSNAGAQKIVCPLLSMTIDEPSNNSSSLPPTWFT
jgi:hypothetical protein